MAVELTRADYAAIENGDHVYLNGKGANFYRKEKYEEALEYYRLAAAMGNIDAISNLGYCYMYGRSIPKSMSLALAYFKIAAAGNNIDAMYKLGNIYKNGADGIEPDNETAIYYYLRAAEIIETHLLDGKKYPSLYFAIAKELMPGGSLFCDLERAYEFLTIAEEGYKIEEEEGAGFYKKSLAAVTKLKQDPCFDVIRPKKGQETSACK